MVDTLSASELRYWAARCLTSANDPRCSAGDRERLLKMRASLLDLARNADWLAGHAVQPQQPHGETRRACASQ